VRKGNHIGIILLPLLSLTFFTSHWNLCLLQCVQFHANLTTRILQRYLKPRLSYNYTPGLGKRTADILKFYFRFDFDLPVVIGILFCISTAYIKFRVNRSVDVMSIFKMAEVSHVVFHVR